MIGKSVLEKLWQVNRDAEMWWDSSPVIYSNWRTKMIRKAANKEEMRTWLDRLYHSDNKPEENIFKGVTTNPPLSYNAIKDNPDYWSKWVDELLEKERSLDVETVFWQTYKEIVRRGAQAYLPIYESTNYQYGYISGQVDPRNLHNVEKMMAQAMDLRTISPNVMIKVPGTAAGYEVIKKLTAQGIPTNNTLSFVISQFIECMNAVVEGLKEARANGVDLAEWRSVITAMSARYGTLGDLQKDARGAGISLDETDVRWAEIAIFKKACRLVKENSEYPGKMLLCSMRMSPQIGDQIHCWHLEKVAGANIVYTCPPAFIESLFEKGRHLDFSDQIDEPVPQKVIDRLIKIPYFERGYAEDGYNRHEFDDHPALLATAKEFSGATHQMVEFVASRIAQHKG